MIGQVENITRFGLFVKISADELTDEIKKSTDKTVSNFFLFYVNSIISFYFFDVPKSRKVAYDDYLLMNNLQEY